MAFGGNFVLDKGYVVADDYNSSSSDGVEAYRAVDLSSDEIDLQTTAGDAIIGVVQEDIDADKVATGKAVASVRLMGITKMRVNGTPGSINQMSKVAAGAAGGAILATTGDVPIGINLTSGTIAEDDLIDVLLTPGLPDLT